MKATKKTRLRRGDPTPDAVARKRREHPDCTLLFRVGTYYMAFDEDAAELSSVLGLELGECEGMFTVRFPTKAMSKTLADLTRRGRQIRLIEKWE